MCICVKVTWIELLSPLKKIYKHSIDFGKMYQESQINHWLYFLNIPYLTIDISRGIFSTTSSLAGKLKKKYAFRIVSSYFFSAEEINDFLCLLNLKRVKTSQHPASGGRRLTRKLVGKWLIWKMNDFLLTLSYMSSFTKVFSHSSKFLYENIFSIK